MNSFRLLLVPLFHCITLAGRSSAFGLHLDNTLHFLTLPTITVHVFTLSTVTITLPLLLLLLSLPRLHNLRNHLRIQHNVSLLALLQHAVQRLVIQGDRRMLIIHAISHLHHRTMLHSPSYRLSPRLTPTDVHQRLLEQLAVIAGIFRIGRFIQQIGTHADHGRHKLQHPLHVIPAVFPPSRFPRENRGKRLGGDQARGRHVWGNCT